MAIALDAEAIPSLPVDRHCCRQEVADDETMKARPRMSYSADKTA